MKLVCVGTAVMLSLAPVGTLQARAALSWQGAASPAGAPSVLGSKEERVGKAAGFYEKGRFVEAALEFEGLVQDFPNDANFRFNAAVSRYGAGHYYESVDLIDAFHPQTILAWLVNDRLLTPPNGAPLRLRVEKQLGYKHAKYLMRIEAVASLAHIGGGKGGYWEDSNGYEWYAGI